MDLPRIPNPYGGTVIPAVAEKRYDDLYFVGVTIDIRPTREDKFLTLHYAQYHHGPPGEFNPQGTEENLHIPDFWAWVAAQRANPEAPTMREQWVGLGLQLGTLEMHLDAAEKQLAPLAANERAKREDRNTAAGQLAFAQNALETARVALGALPPEATPGELDAAQRAVVENQEAVNEATAALEAATAELEAATAACGPAVYAIECLKAQLGIA